MEPTERDKGNLRRTKASKMTAELLKTNVHTTVTLCDTGQILLHSNLGIENPIKKGE